jgi:hypothetical protein
MNADALLLLLPTMNTPSFLTLANEMLGYSPARAADSAGLKNQQHLLACLAAFRNQKLPATVKAAKDVYDLLNYGCLFASDDIDMAVILEVLCGMPFALTETKLRGVQAAIAVGSLRDWRTAIVRGCRQDQPEFVRRVYDKLYTQFCNAGLTDVFAVKSRRTLPDNTFTLEE